MGPANAVAADVRRVAGAHGLPPAVPAAASKAGVDAPMTNCEMLAAGVLARERRAPSGVGVASGR
jgi:hypothetical protein